MKNIVLLVCLWLGLTSVHAQVLVDFENLASVPSLSPASAKVVDNPLKNTVNPSSKVGMYNKELGNWKYFTMSFATPVQINKNNTLTFKVYCSTTGRIFAKFWNGGNVLIESWAPTYDFQPTANKWVECKMDLTGAMGKQFDKLEIATLVDYGETLSADVYLDDFTLSNPLIISGIPVADFTASALTIKKGESVTFNSSKSIDYDGDIVAYNWNFEDGSTSTDANPVHQFNTAGTYNVTLTITDNDGIKVTKAAYIFVIDPAEKIAAMRFTTPSFLTNKKIEGVFQINSNYGNVYNPDTVKVDAEITLPDAKSILVPCFYYEKAKMEGQKWVNDASLSSWMLRFSSTQTGVHKVKLRVVDKAGTFYSSEYSVDVQASSNLGIIKVDEANKQFYRHTTGQPYFPMGINVGWNNTDAYTTILNNLGFGDANLVRYWHTGFANQALEWKKSDTYKGLGYYSQQAAGMSDSILALCEKNNLNLQLTIFQHGMVSETVDSNWKDNPLNKVNGGYITNSEEFFYNDDCKKNTRNKLRYIIARWGYSSNIFAWELFNEVNFSGNHPSQSAKWFPGVLQWHSEMSKYLKENDPFQHITTTSVSGKDDMLLAMDTITHLEVLQYHIYDDNMLLAQTRNDSVFQSKLKNKAIINGEYGTNNKADVPFDMQRAAIWNSIMTRVPHLMWIWDYYKDSDWSDLFKMPASFVKNIDFAKETEIKPVKASAATSSKQSLMVTGFATKTSRYLYIHDASNGVNIENAVLKLTDLPYATYNITYYLPVENTTNTVENVTLVAPLNKIVLPKFSKGIALRIDFKEAYTLPVAIAGNDTIIGIGKSINFKADRSFSQIAKPLSYTWSIVSKPAKSNLVLSNVNQKNMDVTFDAAGLYKIGLVVKDDAESVLHFAEVYVSAPPVAVAGNDTLANKIRQKMYFKGDRSYDVDGDILTYQWSLISSPNNVNLTLYNATTSKLLVQPSVEGEYTFALVVNDGYSDSKADTVKLIYNYTGTGIENNALSAISLYPNPTNDQVVVKHGVETTAVELIDITGKQIARVSTKQTTSTTLNLNQCKIESGVYFVKVNSTNNSQTFKLIYKK